MKSLKYLLFSIAALSLAACADDILVPSGHENGLVTDRPIIELPLYVEVEPELTADGLPMSRAIEDTDDGVDAEIHDVWIMQFECPAEGAAADDNSSVSDDALLIYWDYIPDYDITDPGKRTGKFVVSSHPCFVVILANTLNPGLGDDRMSPELKFSYVKQWRDVLSSQSDLFTTQGTKNSAVPFPGNYTNHIIRMNGITPMRSGINISTPRVTVPVKRNIARIDVSCVIADQLKASGFTIDEMELCEVPDITYMFTNGNYCDDFTTGRPEMVDAEGKPVCFPIDASCRHFDIDDPIVTPTADLPTGTDYKARFYAAANQRGTHLRAEQFASEKYKAYSAPANATYLKVRAHYTSDGEPCPLIYTYFLGKDLGETDATGHAPDYMHDFNILPNHAYSYTLTFNSLTNPDTDPRVEDFGSVTFPTDEYSNCYILNPPDVSGYARKFNIPVGRVDEFWGDSRLGDNPDKCLKNERDWVVEIIWTDFIIDEFNSSRPEGERLEIVKSTGRGKNDYFTVAVPRGFEAAKAESGNVVVGIKHRAEDTEYLWSWHLWLTDYNPDREFTVTEGTYLYPVPNGNICRLGGDDWTTGVYKDAFIMDRNIGATCRTEPGYPATANGSGLIYGYGRKDPFKRYVYKEGKKGAKGDGTVAIASFDPRSLNDPDKIIPYSIAHPDIGFRVEVERAPYNKFWTKATITWSDPRIPNSESYPLMGVKSIFDPSPLGWIVPSYQAFNDIKTNINKVTNNGLTNPNIYRRGFPITITGDVAQEGAYNGLVYWPNVDPWKETVPETAIYFHNSEQYWIYNVYNHGYGYNCRDVWTTTTEYYDAYSLNYVYIYTMLDRQTWVYRHYPVRPVRMHWHRNK